MSTFDTGDDLRPMETIRLGIRYSPELTEGLKGTLVLAVLASLGQVVVPIAVQQTLDHGIRGEGGPDVSFTVWVGLFAAVAIVVTSWASYAMTTRLFSTSERGLATLRIKAFRHVHDLPLLTQNTERRGALVSRVTWSTSLVTRETRAPRRSVFWVSSGRSWTCRKALIRRVARPRSEVENNRVVMAYDAQLVTTIATAAIRPTQTVKETSGPPSPRMPWSRVCCTAIGTTTWPSEASTASTRVPLMPSISSGE